MIDFKHKYSTSKILYYFNNVLTVAPQIGAFTFGTEPVNAGDVISVLCIVSKGDFPMDIQWMFKDEPIDDKRDDIVIMDSGKRGKQLTIESVGAAHAGEYTCVASNIAGSTTRTAVLDVNGILNLRLRKVV